MTVRSDLLGLVTGTAVNANYTLCAPPSGRTWIIKDCGFSINAASESLQLRLLLAPASGSPVAVVRSGLVPAQGALSFPGAFIVVPAGYVLIGKVLPTGAVASGAAITSTFWAAGADLEGVAP